MAAKALLAVAVLTFASSAWGQATVPFNGINKDDASAVCYKDSPTGPITFVADANNACVYWECIRIGRSIILTPRNCSLQTAVSSFFGMGAANPCTEIFDHNAVKFDCTRKEFNLNINPSCYAEYLEQGTCKNGGEVSVVYGKCECKCASGFTGWRCENAVPPAGQTVRPVVPGPNPDDPCPNGIPKQDWCQLAGGNPCQNNGRCINQCINYVCLCSPPFTAGRNCETFRCSKNVECMNGGTCSRGADGNNQYFTCACRSDFSGKMCEQKAL